MSRPDSAADSSGSLYAVINEAGPVTPLTIAHIGLDEAIFESREAAETARQQLIAEYDHDDFRVHRVVTEPVGEGETRE